ncbi:MAG: hypothetical protein ACTSQJ_03830 [Promethearchaeota archaeon]
MKYILDQTFNYVDNSTYKHARTTIKIDISFLENGDWKNDVLYKVNLYEGTCDNEVDEKFNFKYVFSNDTRKINKVIESYADWDIKNKYPSFYCGKKPENEEIFLIDEIMLLRKSYGIIQRSFEKIEQIKITLTGNSYDTFEFWKNFTVLLNYG